MATYHRSHYLDWAHNPSSLHTVYPNPNVTVLGDVFSSAPFPREVMWLCPRTQGPRRLDSELEQGPLQPPPVSGPTQGLAIEPQARAPGAVTEAHIPTQLPVQTPPPAVKPATDGGWLTHGASWEPPTPAPRVQLT